jgi:hypothetical protein
MCTDFYKNPVIKLESIFPVNSHIASSNSFSSPNEEEDFSFHFPPSNREKQLERFSQNSCRLAGFHYSLDNKVKNLCGNIFIAHFS